MTKEETKGKVNLLRTMEGKLELINSANKLYENLLITEDTYLSIITYLRTED